MDIFVYDGPKIKQLHKTIKKKYTFQVQTRKFVSE